MARTKPKRSKRLVSSCKKIATRKSARSIRAIRNADYYYDSESEVCKSYKLNHSKALDKKQVTCHSSKYQKEFKSGEQMRLHLSTATYEVFKRVLYKLYKSGHSSLLDSHQLYADHKFV